MLKTLFACLFAALVATPTLPPGVPLVGMTKSQVEVMLGEPLGRFGLQLGQLSAAGLTSETCEYEGVTIHYSYGTVTRVTLTR